MHIDIYISWSDDKSEAGEVGDIYHIYIDIVNLELHGIYAEHKGVWLGLV